MDLMGSDSPMHSRGPSDVKISSTYQGTMYRSKEYSGIKIVGIREVDGLCMVHHATTLVTSLHLYSLRNTWWIELAWGPGCSSLMI